MSEGTQDKLSGKAHELGGKVEQAAGNLTGNDELKGRGETDEAAGKAEGFLGNVKDALGNVVDGAKGAVESIGDKIKDATHHHDENTNA